MNFKIFSFTLKTSFQIFFFIQSLFFLVPLTLFRVWRKFMHDRQTQINPISHAHPDLFCSEMEIVSAKGYHAKKYEFITDDNAFVSFWRIVRDESFEFQNQSTQQDLSYNETLGKSKKTPIILQHGLLDCSLTWFMHQKRQNNLPYLLASKGYDVWVGNNRGTRYSTKQNQTDDFWNYNIDHLIQFDIPCMINSILKQTEEKQLIYIGHSQGTLQFLSGLDVHPELKSKVKCFVGLGPLISLKNLKGKHFLVSVVDFFRIPEIVKYFGFNAMFILPYWMAKLIGVLIYNVKLLFHIVHFAIRSLCGFNCNGPRIRKQRLGLIVSHQPGGSSVCNVTHWMQIYRAGQICKYDHGAKRNKQLYGQEKPPAYTFNSLKHLPFKSYLFRGTHDSIIMQEDFTILTQSFHKDKHEVHILNDYAHLDYLWCEDACQDFYWKIVDIVEGENSNYQKEGSEDSESTE